MLIIGITGTSGAGKGTVTEYLMKEKGFVHFSARAFIVEEVEKRGLPVDRDSMTVVANDLRKSNGASYVIEQLLSRAQEFGVDAVIESVRVVGEVELLHKAGAILLSVDADQKVRYARITARQNESDHVSFEKFVEQENTEMHSSDPTKQSIRDVMNRADVTIQNNGSVKELYTQIEKALKEK
jgi:dephospho-CoA kinase